VQDTVIPATKTEQGIQASDIDTRSFFPAIDTRPIPLQTPPENPVRKPLPGGEKSNLPVGAIDKLSATVNPGAQFAGMTMNGWYPPDADIAVGSSHIVEVVNSSFAIYTRTGTKQLEQTFQTLFNGVAVATMLFDPKVIYDRYVSSCQADTVGYEKKQLSETNNETSLLWWFVAHKTLAPEPFA